MSGGTNSEKYFLSNLHAVTTLARVLIFENLCQAASTAANAQTAALATLFSARHALHQHTPPAGHSIKQSAVHGGRRTPAVAQPSAKRTLTYPDAGGTECKVGKGSEEGPEEVAPGTPVRAPEARTPEQRARSPDPLHLSARSTLPSHTPGQRAKGGDSISASSTPPWQSPDSLLSSATKTPSQQTPPQSLALDCLTPRAANTKAFGRLTSPGVGQRAYYSHVTPLRDVPRSRHSTQSSCHESEGKTQIPGAAVVVRSLGERDDDDSDDSLNEEGRQGMGRGRGDVERGPARSSPGRHHVLDQCSPGQVERERNLLTINK